MRLVVTQDGVAVEFVEPRAEGAYPWLSRVGTLLLSARAGHLENVGRGESANVPVELLNTGREASTLLGRPLRAAAVLYDDDGDEYFAGLIQRVAYGPVMELSIEA